MAFNNPIISGGGDLVVPRIQSPNFVHTVSGWQINQDGSAEFQDVIIAGGGGGATVTFSATAPVSPSVGDLWYDTANGLEVSQWNGSAWVAYQIGSGAIASGAIGTSEIASGAVTSALLAANAALANIGAAGVTSTYLASGVALANIGAGGLTSSYLAAGTALANLSPASVTASLLAASAALSNIGAGGITASYIAADAIVAGAIAANAVTTGTLAAGAVTAAKIAANTITASQLAAGIVYAGIVNGTLIEGAQFVAYGTTGELLIYSGTPAAGNLIMSVSAQTGTDAYGNIYYPVLSVGDQSAQHLSIDDQGNLFVANAADTIVFEIASLVGCILIYNSSGIGAGNLLVAISPVSGNDGSGNDFAQGLTVFGANGSPVGISMPTTNPHEVTNGFVATGVHDPGVSGQEYLYLEIDGPQMTGTLESDWVQIGLNSSSWTNASSAIGELTYYSNTGTPSTYVLWNVNGLYLYGINNATYQNVGLPSDSATGAVTYAGSGHLKYVGSDNSAYNTGRATFALANTQTINTTGALQITGFGWNVVSGTTYRIHGWLECQQGSSAQVQNLGFSGPSTSLARIQYYYVEQAASAESFSVNSNLGSLTTAASPAYGAGATFTFMFDGVITFSGTGTLKVIGEAFSAADTFTVIAGSFAELMPVT